MLSRFAMIAAYIGHARLRHLLIGGSTAIAVILAASMGWFVVSSRGAAIADAGREMRNDALMLAEQEDRLLQAVDVVQLALIEHMRSIGIDTAEKFASLMATREVHQNLRDRIAGMSYMSALSLSDRQGRLLNFSLRWPPPAIDDHDRDFIVGLQQPGAPEIFISEPALSKSTGRWTIYLSRRFQAPNNEPIGFVISTIAIDYFERYYASLPLSGEGSYVLYRRDGVLLARYPHVDPQIGRSFANTPNFQRVVAALGSSVRLHSTLDGQDRLVASRAMEHFPLIIVVSDTMNSILRTWGSQIRVLIGTTVLAELVILGITLLGSRHLIGYERLQVAEAAQARAETDLALAAERERAAQVLHAQERRFQVAISNLIQGLLMFDKADRLLVANERMCTLFGLAPGALEPGLTYREVTDRFVADGDITADDMQIIRCRRAELVCQNESATVTWVLTSGRAFTVTHQPMADGWLSTFEEVSERREAEARIVHLAHHDALTDLPNRVLFRERLEDALAHARRGDCLALHCLDLDQFKAVNDTLGHPTGDALLQAVAARLLEQTRDTDLVARLGGDEFALIQAPIEKPTDATGLADRLLELFETPFDIGGHQIVIGTSIGIAFAPQDGIGGDHILKCADLALYRAKTDGRGVYRLFHREMDAQMQVRRRLELDLRQALRTQQFILFYQPLVDLRTGTVTGLEALLRWRHPERGIVSPAEFIPLAEEIGLIVPLGEWVLRQACAAAAGWPDASRVAVNLSPAQFRSRNLVAAVTQALAAARLPAARLELEITETVMLQDTDATLATLHQLRALGVGIAMDDFGTGYSSLSYLRRFPFDRIKIDQSFVRDLCQKSDCCAIVRAVTGLSSELGMATTAEGVENAEQLELLKRAGCTEVQGYLFSPAVPVGEIPGLMRRIGGVQTAAVADLVQ